MWWYKYIACMNEKVDAIFTFSDVWSDLSQWRFEFSAKAIEYDVKITTQDQVSVGFILPSSRDRRNHEFAVSYTCTRAVSRWEWFQQISAQWRSELKQDFSEFQNLCNSNHQSAWYSRLRLPVPPALLLRFLRQMTRTMAVQSRSRFTTLAPSSITQRPTWRQSMPRSILHLPGLINSPCLLTLDVMIGTDFIVDQNQLNLDIVVCWVGYCISPSKA